VLYAYLASLGFPIIPEDVTNKGRIDLTLQLPDKTYIFEFKVVDQPTYQALHQITTKQYYEKYIPSFLAPKTNPQQALSSIQLTEKR